MTDGPRLTPAKQAEQTAKAERLAQALRQNLHRRKQQARTRDADAAGDDDPAPRPRPAS